MLKKIPKILSPELLKVLSEMGHGDRLCIGDGNFPGASMAKSGNTIFLRADGHGVPELLDAILEVFPLDSYVETPVMLMEKMDCDKDKEIPVWEEYKKIVAKHDERGEKAFGAYERFEFYDRAKECYCILQSGESAIYANIILQKGLCFEHEHSKLMNMRKSAVERLRTFSIRIIGGQAFFRFGSGVSSARSGMSRSSSGRFSISRM